MSHLESHITQREYYKIFAGTNQEQNNEKLHLGYEASTTEITLKKDQTTFFHVPFFAETQHIQDSNLIGAGAIPGPIPAGADRIFKKLGDYSNSTPWGSTAQRLDGTWLCSWLYAVSSESPQWLDRYYNPGNLSYQDALTQGINFLTYQKHDPVYYDVPSTLTLESGVWYQYFHQGEKTASEFIKTFAGVNKTRLCLDIDDWSATPLDKSIYNNQITIDNFSQNWVSKEASPSYIDRNILSFNNTDFIDCKITYSDDYNLKNEFSLAFWVKSIDWSKSSSTQLVGNLNRGGYSLFFDDLKYYPFFVISETTYGHFFLFNQEGQIYNEKNSQIVVGQPINFFNVHINSEGELIGVEGSTSSGQEQTNYKIYKFNHLGEVQTLTRDQENNTIALNGIPKLSILNEENGTIVITTSGTYTFDRDLILTSYLSSQPYVQDEQICFDYNGNFVRQSNCVDIKYDSNNAKWHINTAGQLYCNDILFSSVTNATNIHVDPNNDLWILAEKNLVYKINTTTKQIITTFYVGTDAPVTDIKNISFIHSYTRSTGLKTWYALIYHSDEKTLYQVTLDGVIKQSIYLPQKLNILETETSRQDRDALTFLSKGDFTGYEWKRIFHKILYNNNIQIQFKVAVQSPTITNKNTIYKISAPVSNLVNNEWHLIVATIKNKELKLYIDNYLRGSITLDSNLDLSYIYKNNLFIGCPTGKSENFNKEINSQSLIWDGYIDSIRIYDYAIDESFIQYFIKEKIQGDDIIWNLITAPLQYVESIDRFFKHRVPGYKSNYFNIKINQSEITDPQLRETIENDIRAALLDIIPKNTELLSIKWD